VVEVLLVDLSSSGKFDSRCNAGYNPREENDPIHSVQSEMTCTTTSEGDAHRDGLNDMLENAKHGRMPGKRKPA
jgi:hypothetical protein